MFKFKIKDSSCDIFNKNFKPYISYTKGFWTYDYSTKKKVYIKPHYAYVDKYSVTPLRKDNIKHKTLYNKIKNQDRIFYSDKY